MTTAEPDPRPPRPPVGVPRAAVAVAVAGCGGSASGAPDGKIPAVGAENQYANVIEQIGGRYVDVSAVESDPNTDPHTFEASASVAQQVAGADVVVQNGLGYDSYMDKIESASPSDSRKVIDVQELLGLPDSTPNPHLWYKPETMPAVARQLVADFAELQPGAQGLLRGEPEEVRSLAAALARRPRRIRDASSPAPPVATTEPVADYMLEAAGIENLTPFSDAGRHHERRRPGAPGGRRAGRLLHRRHRPTPSSTTSR